MALTVPDIVLAAKQLEIEELKRLQSRSHLVGVISHLIHALQAERGASSIYLGSSGKRFGDTRRKLIAESQAVERLLRSVIEEDLRNASVSNAKLLPLLAWTLLGLDALPDLRGRITNLLLTGNESLAAFSRLIAGLISMIFEVADAAVDPGISRMLVALFNLVEGKEWAGQERAVGALMFGSGRCDGPLRERILHLIEAQERSIRVFLEFAGEELPTRWRAMDDADFVAQLQGLREMIRTATPDMALDTGLADAWFDCCSERITCIWSFQRELVDALRVRCQDLIAQAERERHDSEGLLRSLRQTPPARADASDRFFDPQLPVELSVSFGAAANTAPDRARSIIDVLQAQSRHLADMENELESARRALAERKVIERAKGMLMAQYRVSEDDAYKMMRKLSMDRNLRLIQVAESVLA